MTRLPFAEISILQPLDKRRPLALADRIAGRNAIARLESCEPCLEILSPFDRIEPSRQRLNFSSAESSEHTRECILKLAQSHGENPDAYVAFCTTATEPVRSRSQIKNRSQTSAVKFNCHKLSRLVDALGGESGEVSI